MIPEKSFVRIMLVAFSLSTAGLPGVLKAQFRPDDNQELSKVEAARFAGLHRAARAFVGRPMEIDVRYYRLDIRVSGIPATIRGNVSIDAVVWGASRDSVALDISTAHIIDSAIVNGTRSLRVSRIADAAYILLPRSYAAGEPLSLVVFYHGSPPTGTGLGSFDTKTISDGSPWYSSLSEPYGGRLWWPSVDHPSDKADSADIWLTCDSALTAVSNGLLTETVNNVDGTRTFKWRHRYPIATYLIAATIGKLQTWTDWYRYSPGDSLPITNYATPDLPQSSRNITSMTPQAMGIFESMFGPYPFRREKYGHVQFTWTGGMEHQTLTSLGTNAWREQTIAHELAHQWFGDLITCRTWPDLWLNEGFAQYFDAVYLERAYPNGRAKLDSAMAARAASARSAPGTLRVQDTLSVSNLFLYSRVYLKGSWVLHMLRHVLGDSIFFASIKAYAGDSGLMYKTASTEDFRRVCESVSGRDLGWFFSEWVFGERYPSFVYSWYIVPEGQRTRVTVRITQTTGTSNPSYFTMPVDLRITGTGLDTMVVAFTSGVDQTFSFSVPSPPGAVTFDPGNWILKTVSAGTANVGSDGLPMRVELHQNYPNPFNPGTEIRFEVPVAGHVELRVFDMMGREVRTLVQGEMSPGEHRLIFDANGFPSGTYICRMIAGRETRSIRMVLLR